MRKTFYISCYAVLALILGFQSAAQQKIDCVIVAPRNASFQEMLAAKEIRRYVYLRTGALLSMQQADRIPPKMKAAIVVGNKERPLLQRLDQGLAVKVRDLKADAYALRTIGTGGKTLVAIVGGDGPGTLYGAYRFAEHMGVAFGLDGDVVPDDRIPFVLPVLDETSAPLFRLRGIQPFHDFSEGPDWWETGDYLAIIGQLPKMGMNFFGLHTYPEGAPNAEPGVWIGRNDEWNPDGTVREAYPASWQNSTRGNATWDNWNWGYRPMKTSDYRFGLGMLFDRDDYGSDIMRGLTPEPQHGPGMAEVFNRAGTMLGTAFNAARQLGVKTCIGTETFLTVPKQVRARLVRDGKDPNDSLTLKELYKGMFARIAATYPLDYYWFWTPEGWTWSDAGDEPIRRTMTDLSAAVQAAKETAAPFQLATCGWVLGPPKDRGLFDRELPKNIAVSCINREVGKAPVDPAFSRIDGRSRWAIPWMEDDPSLIVPQLWAGRTRKDAADALAYGCDGLLGIHWRTRILSPNFMALSRAAWNQKPWNGNMRPAAERRGPVNGTFLTLPDSVRIEKTDLPEVYRTIRDRVFGYHLDVPNGTYRVVLQFCDTLNGGWRQFDVMLQGRKVVDSLDITGRAGKASALDLTFDTVKVTNGLLRIDFGDRMGFPSIAGIVIEGASYARRINCGGPALGNYEADEPPTPRWLPMDDLYQEWALRQFGVEAAEAAARVFSSVDSRLPEPATWINGPGNVRPHNKAWEEVQKEYAFVDSFRQIRPMVRGKGNLERFDFWLNSFEHMRGTAKLGCLWGEYMREHDRVLAVKPVPASMLRPSSGDGQGLLGRYFDNMTLEGAPVCERVDSVVDLRWGGKPPCPGLRPDSFSVRWTGTLVVDTTSPGRVGIACHDGARLYVDGRLIADNWPMRSIAPVFADFEFQAGRRHDIRLEYFQNTVHAEVQLLWGTAQPDTVQWLARSVLLPLRKEMIETVRELYGHLLATVTNTSELGTIANWEQHNLPILLDDPGAELERLAGSPLSEDLKLPRLYDGPPRLVVPTVRTMTVQGEPLKLKVLVLSAAPPTGGWLKWRTMGSGLYSSQPLKHVGRGVYVAVLPVSDADVEYYVEVKVGDQTLHFPASAPEIAQTVVVTAKERSVTSQDDRRSRDDPEGAQRDASAGREKG